VYIEQNTVVHIRTGDDLTPATRTSNRNTTLPRLVKIHFYMSVSFMPDIEAPREAECLW